MSPVAVGLDLLLITLLLVALGVGLRLNKRLKALREGQLHFVTAVGELDQAAARAEAGLTALRIASEEAHDTLLTRIETARALINKLEAVSAEAERVRAVAQTATPAPAPVPVPQALARAEARLDPRFRELERMIARRPAAVRGLDDDLFETDDAPPLRAQGRR